MSEANLDKILQAGDQIKNEILAKESHLMIPVVGDIIQNVIKVLKEPEFKGQWNRTIASKFYHLAGLINKKGQLKANEKELFRVNVGLEHILKLLKKEAGLRVSCWPQVRLANRQYLALEYYPYKGVSKRKKSNKKKDEDKKDEDKEDEKDEDKKDEDKKDEDKDGEDKKDEKKADDQLRQLQEFHALLQTFVKSSPNFGTKQEEICARLILSMIALDGVFGGNADGLISHVTKNRVHLDRDMPLIEVPLSSKKQANLKHYFLGRYTIKCLKILMPRATKAGVIFPDDWLMTSKHHKKRPRRIELEKLLTELWRKTFPDRSLPEYMDVNCWIKSSRLSCALGGVPFIAIAHLRNRLSGAQIPVLEEHTTPTPSLADAGKENGDSFKWVRSMHQAIRRQEVPDEKLNLRSIQPLACELKRDMEQAKSDGVIGENEINLADWLIWMIGQERFKDMRLSTYQGYISSVANRVFPLPDNKSLKDLTGDDWTQIIKDLAANEDYMPSTRRTAITHLKVLNAYMNQQGLAPKVDFKNYKFRVLREIAECSVIFPHEVDQLLARTQSDKLWLAIMFAFYCGLRCEEVCYLRLTGFESNYRFVIGRSKLQSSRRTVPHGMLIPEKHQERLQDILMDCRVRGDEYLFEEEDGFPIPTWKLSKRVGRLLVKNESRVKKMHALRHGFASWQLVRYYMLVDHHLRDDVRVGRFNLDLDGRHEWFQDEMLGNFAELMGGIRWRMDYENKGNCTALATDLIMISKLLGHASRFTTLENYTNTIGWLCRYYLQKREAMIMA